jgi:hypothetical protein
MATVRLTLKGAPENISLRSFADALTHSVEILEDLDLAISREAKGSLEWVVTQLATGSLSVTLESRSKLTAHNFGPDTANAFVTGLDKIEKEGASPPYLSEYGIKQARSLAALIGRDGVAGINVTDLQQTAELSPVAVENARKLIQIKTSAIGSVEGTIETLSIHGKARFVIYHLRTRKAISCQFDREKWFEKTRDMMGKRVTVHGLVHYNIKGEPQRVEIEDMRLARDSRELPTIEELSGSDPNFTGTLSTEEYIRQIRNG